MKLSEGQRVPEVTFRIRRDGEWKDLTTQELFSGRRVVVFALPGAFTPTCSSSHVPRYNELAPELAARGVDTILCIAVNDAYVMEEWAKNQHAEHIAFVPDSTGEFTDRMGMLVDKEDLGSKRSWRYSMLAHDGVIEKMFIEPDRPGDPYEVSDADTMLRHLDPEASPPHDVVMFTKPGCAYCVKAKRMLAERGWPYDELPATPRRLRAVSGKSSTPQVFIDGKYIGGSDELAQYLATVTPRA